MSKESSEFRVTDVVLDRYGSPCPVVEGTPTRIGTFLIEAYLDVPEGAQSVHIAYAMDPRNWRVRERA